MDSVLTVRLDTDLKERGTRVMERHGLTPSQSVRKLFAYAAQNDTLPFEGEQSASREDIARRIAAFDACHTKTPLSLSDDELRALRLRERYGFDD